MKKLLLVLTLALCASMTFAQNIPSYVPTDGLVGYWPFNGNANDESGNENNGTVNGATLTTDRNGNENSSYSFSGSNISVPITANLHNLPIRTFSCWFYANGEQSGGRIYETTYLNGGIAMSNGNILDAWYYNGANECNVININTGTLNQWHNLVYISDGNTGDGTIYLDGIFNSSRTGVHYNSPQIWQGEFIRFGLGASGEIFNGDIDDIAIYNRALTQEEISALYQGCALSITTQPTNQTTNISNNAQFTVESSDPDATYQWQTDLGVGFQNISNAGQYKGATTSALTIANTTLSNNNQLFRCFIAKASCTDTSSVVTLNVNEAIPSNVPTDGLVGYWPFNGNTNDASSNGYNGTPSNVTATTNRFGDSNSAYSFNGTTSRIDVTTAFFNVGWNQFTISCWMNTANANNTNNNNDSKALINTDGHNGIAINIYGSNNPFSSTWDNKYIVLAGSNPAGSRWDVFGPTIPVSSDSVTLSTWNHIVLVKNSNIYYLYVNGVLDNTTYTGIVTPSSSLCKMVFGALATGISPEVFLGKLDDYGIWNRALTQDEVTSLYYSENTCQSLVINTGVLSFNPPTYNNTVTIYPNPANDHITIDCGNLANVSGWSIKIFNTLGQEVFSGSMNTQQYVVPLNTWSGQGVYFVKIYDASNHLINTKKIILQ